MTSFGADFAKTLRDQLSKQSILHKALLRESEGFYGTSLKCFLNESLKVAIDLFRSGHDADVSYTVRVMVDAMLNTPTSDQVKDWTSVKILHVIDIEQIMEIFKEI